METLATIRMQRALRAYADQRVTDEQLVTVLDAGRRAGSGGNRQPWQFIVVRDAHTRAALARCGRYAAHLASAPVIIVVVMPDEQFWSGFDAGRVAQNMMLAATDLGLGTCVVALQDVECTQRLLALPEDRNAQVAIALGVPASPEPTPEERQFMRAVLHKQGREPLSELVHCGQWGRRTPPASSG
jgi:nitroreductase